MNVRDVASRIAAELRAVDIPDADFEAELLVRHISEITRATYFTGPEFDAARCAALHEIVARRLQREPAAYLLGRREFYGLDFAVGPGVLVPRPETELLVEAALAEVGDASLSVLDVGAGSGCVAVAIAVNAPRARVVAVDASPAALRIAAGNRDRHGAAVDLIRGDLASAVARADVVVANLPYIPGGDIEGLQPEIRDWEPREALDGGADGLDLLRRLIDDCGARLRPRLLALEVGFGQAPDVARLVAGAGGTAGVATDLAGIERMVTGRWM